MTSRKLKLARTVKLKWTQKKLGEELGLRSYCISKYERGAKIPRTTELSIRYLMIRESASFE